MTGQAEAHIPVLRQPIEVVAFVGRALTDYQAPLFVSHSGVRRLALDTATWPQRVNTGLVDATSPQSTGKCRLQQQPEQRQKKRGRHSDGPNFQELPCADVFPLSSYCDQPQDGRE